MTLKEKEIAERQYGKFKIVLPNKKFYILNHFTVKSAKVRAKEIANKERLKVVLIDITDKSNYIDTVRPNLILARGGCNG